MPPGPEGSTWGGLGCVTLPCASQSFGLPLVQSRCQTCPAAIPSLEQAAIRQVWDRHRSLGQRYRPPAKASPLSATSSAPCFSPPAPPQAIFTLPPKKGLGSCSCCGVPQPPCAPRHGQAAAAGTGMCQGEPVPGPRTGGRAGGTHGAASEPSPGGTVCWKLNRMSEIKMFLLPKQPGNASFHRRQPQRWHTVECELLRGFWPEEGGDRRVLQEGSGRNLGSQRGDWGALAKARAWRGWV